MVLGARTSKAVSIGDDQSYGDKSYDKIFLDQQQAAFSTKTSEALNSVVPVVSEISEAGPRVSVYNQRIHQTKFPPVPEFAARAVLAFDPNSGAVAFSQNTNERLAVASLTKLMTAVVAFEDPRFEEPITISSQDRVEISPSLHLRAGDSVRPLDLIHAMLVGSANDAAQALANHMQSRGDFVQAMNSKAQSLGMADTHFSTPIGFDIPQNHSSANDMKILVDYAFRRLPYKELWQSRNFSFTSLGGTSYKIQSSSKISGGRYNINTIKTGLSPEALGNIIVLAEDGKGNRIVSIILGSTDRDTDTSVLVDYIFRNFSWSD